MKKKDIFGKLLNICHLLKRNVEKSHNTHITDKLTGTNGRIIGYLAHNPDKDIFQKDLEDILSLRRSTVSKIIKLMEQKGFILREPVAYDARLKKLTLAPKAIEIAEFVDLDLEIFSQIAFKNLSDEEIDFLCVTLEKIRTNLENNEIECE